MTAKTDAASALAESHRNGEGDVARTSGDHPVLERRTPRPAAVYVNHTRARTHPDSIQIQDGRGGTINLTATEAADLMIVLGGASTALADIRRDLGFDT